MYGADMAFAGWRIGWLAIPMSAWLNQHIMEEREVRRWGHSIKSRTAPANRTDTLNAA